MRRKLNIYFKFGVFLSTIIISIVIAGLYGIINDQVTYTISPEYFTKFKYIQFGINPAELGGARQTVAAIGFLATWWVGSILGVVFGLVALVYKDYKTMFKMACNAIAVTFCITICMGFVGFFYGKFYLAKAGVDWWLPDNLIDKASFITVGSIHNFSYIGGLVGLFAGAMYLFLKKLAEKKARLHPITHPS